MHPVHGLNFVQGHMGVLTAQGGSDGQGRLRDLFTRVRTHDSSALTQGSKMQGSCMSHTCGMSAVCRQHCVCVPTS